MKRGIGMQPKLSTKEQEKWKQMVEPKPLHHYWQLWAAVTVVVILFFVFIIGLWMNDSGTDNERAPQPPPPSQTPSTGTQQLGETTTQELTPKILGISMYWWIIFVTGFGIYWALRG